MVILPWRTRRQFFYFSIFALAVLVLAAGAVWYFYPRPSCTDNKQSGQEEGIDCGGPCTPCLKNLHDISVLWVRFFENRPGVYDVTAMVENSNLDAGISSINYYIKLYDASNIFLAGRQGSTYINPGDRQVIFETGILSGPRPPKYAEITFDAQKNWKYIKKEKSFLSVTRKDFVNIPFPRLTAEIKNEALFDTKNVLVSGILYDESGNAIGASFTKIDSIKAESSQEAVFTWSRPFAKVPVSVEVIATTDLTVNNNHSQ